MLKLDFPRVPPPTAAEPFASLAQRGHDLLGLHLLESPQLDKPITKFKGQTNPEVEKVSYADETVWLDKAQTRGFVGVPEPVWNFHIGGYQVCEKWLKDRQAKGGKNPRPGRKLTADDIAHYGKIVTAIHHTIRLMKEIDEVIDAHGGWPAALNEDGMPRDEFIDFVAAELGYERTSKQVAKAIGNALRAAAQRGIVYTDRGNVFTDCRTIADYPRDLLKKNGLPCSSA